MNRHDDLELDDEELSPAMRGRRKVLASLVGGLAMPLLPNAPWAPDSGVVATRPSHTPVHGSACGDVITDLGINDPINIVKAYIATGIGEIPIVGGILGALFDLLWPESEQSVWDQIKDQVRELVHGAIEDEMLSRLNAVVNGLKLVCADHLKRIQQYQASKSAEAHTRLIASLDTTHKLFLEKFDLFKDDGTRSLRARCQILPLYVQMANFHLVLLRDAAVNAAGYGFDEAGAAIHLEDFQEALARHTHYVDAALQRLFDELHAEYQANRDRVRYDGSNGLADGGWSATGAWETKKIENNTRSLLVAFVEDYRKLWPHMAPGMSRAPALTRELWFGPYGVPDCRDIGCIPSHASTVRPENNPGHKEWVFGANNKPDVVMPATNPGRPIRHVSVPQIDVKRTSDVRWRFPRNFEVYREGDGLTTPGNIFGISLAPQNGGPVVGVSVDTALYVSRGVTFNCATGYLVSGVYFRQRDGRTHSVGSSGAVAREIKNYNGENAPVPKGHVLHEIRQCSTVRKLYTNIGKEAAGAESVGSVMFSFKLADPNLHLNDELMRRVFVGSPTELSVNDLVDMELRLDGASTTAASPSKRAGMRSHVEHEMEAEHLVGDRAAFWRRIDTIAGS